MYISQNLCYNEPVLLQKADMQTWPPTEAEMKSLTAEASLDDLRADAARIVSYWVKAPRCTDAITEQNVLAFIDSLIMSAHSRGRLDGMAIAEKHMVETLNRLSGSKQEIK